MQLEPPNETDRELALQAVLHIDNLRMLGRFADQDTKQSEINHIALMIRNARLGKDR